MTVVSVVIPYYNRADWLETAVDSVLTQTFPDFEVIVVDDGSKEYPRFLEVAGDPRVRYVRQEHRGASAARNCGIRLARGKYVAFLDADDVFLPDKLQIQVGRMEARPDISLSHTSYWRMDAVGTDLELVASGTFGGRVYPEIVRSCPIATPTVMVRREALERQDLRFDESVRIGEDIILWIDLARHHEILGIDRAVTKVRVHGQNAFSDPMAQYRGGMEVLRQAFRKDAEFGFSFRRRALAGVCASAGHLFLEQGQRRVGLRFFARAAAYWPLDPWILSSLRRHIIPERIRRPLRHLRDAVRSRDARLPRDLGGKR